MKYLGWGVESEGGASCEEGLYWLDVHTPLMCSVSKTRNNAPAGTSVPNQLKPRSWPSRLVDLWDTSIV